MTDKEDTRDERSGRAPFCDLKMKEHRNNPGTPPHLLRELDVVQVKETVITEELFGGRIEINAGWEGTIVADADTPTPLIEFTRYREIPILVHLEAGNLTKT